MSSISNSFTLASIFTNGMLSEPSNFIAKATGSDIRDDILAFLPEPERATFIAHEKITSKDELNSLCRSIEASGHLTGLDLRKLIRLSNEAATEFPTASIGPFMQSLIGLPPGSSTNSAIGFPSLDPNKIVSIDFSDLKKDIFTYLVKCNSIFEDLSKYSTYVDKKLSQNPYYQREEDGSSFKYFDKWLSDHLPLFVNLKSIKIDHEASHNFNSVSAHTLIERIAQFCKNLETFSFATKIPISSDYHGKKLIEELTSQAFEHLAKLPRLRTLDLERALVKKGHLVALANFKNLEKIQFPKVTDEELTTILKSTGKNIKALSLPEIGKWQQIGLLAPNLESLTTARIQDENEFLKMIEKIGKNIKILTLRESGNLTSKMIEFLPNVEHLHFENCVYGMNDDVAKKIAKMCPKLISLSIPARQVTSAACFDLAELPKLESISLAGGVTDTGVETLLEKGIEVKAYPGDGLTQYYIGVDHIVYPKPKRKVVKF